jgi:hypothetical protein
VLENVENLVNAADAILQESTRVQSVALKRSTDPPASSFPRNP